jgi:hypothetical protein
MYEIIQGNKLTCYTRTKCESDCDQDYIHELGTHVVSQRCGGIITCVGEGVGAGVGLCCCANLCQS